MAVADEDDLDALPHASPFLLSIQDVDILAESTGFAILRDHLAHYYPYGLCATHTSDHLDQLPRWLLVRDALHALLVPIVELFDRAASLATAATAATKLEELEYAYTGEARSAFLWLQCFLSAAAARDWCYTRGCPVCVVDATLDSEFSLRLLYAACLLSDVHYPFTIDGPTLPSFTFFLARLECACARDPLFGRDFFDRLHPKALATRNGIEELIRQCVDLDALLVVASRNATPVEGNTPVSSAPGSPVLAPLGANPSAGQAKLRVKRSRLARRQMSLQIEEEQWRLGMAKEGWEGRRIDTPGTGDDDDEERPARPFEAGLKLETHVAVREVSAGE